MTVLKTKKLNSKKYYGIGLRPRGLEARRSLYARYPRLGSTDKHLYLRLTGCLSTNQIQVVIHCVVEGLQSFQWLRELWVVGFT